ncbi:methionine ABC transporter ATP-binding protein [Microaerobacter geothermalis]|uniref:methionine ABC transporter ATP-binding protein n=1 Tax=Microaerobacter geothermalis TaxID=674972 RepID=UPI001F25E95D|nr:methionine ABC transporter ATP-binding protein [Microaerobacter geothermalis]MCF6092376.1 methionine ABC transporter ATP-binding protein [Microaerobacter geothermalis]
MIRIKKLEKVFSSGKKQVKALSDINLEVQKGEIFGVIGYSGAGKSTLIRTINMLEPPTSGSIQVSNVEMTRLSVRDLRKARQEIGMIFQHFNLLWSRTVKENIAFPLEIAGVSKENIEKRVNELVELVGLKERADAYPSELSGGQKQRVGIARALANHPKVLLCDEATSALDPKTTDSILDLLKEINEKLGLTIVLITHEMHVIQKICDRVAVIENGKIVEMGTVLEVFSHPKTEIAKRFVKQVTEPDDTLEQLHDWEELLKDGSLVKLSFLGDSAERPLINRLIKKFDVEVNILHGHVNRIQGNSYGTLFLQLIGPEEEQKKAIRFLREEKVEVEHLAQKGGE